MQGHPCVPCLVSQSYPTLTLLTVAHQAPLFMGFSRQEYWNGFLCPPPGHLPHPGIEPVSPTALALQVDSQPRDPWESHAVHTLCAEERHREFSPCHMQTYSLSFHLYIFFLASLGFGLSPQSLVYSARCTSCLTRAAPLVVFHGVDFSSLCSTVNSSRSDFCLPDIWWNNLLGDHLLPLLLFWVCTILIPLPFVR